jgi:hypothetical protein
MENQEYLKFLIDKYNNNPNDETFTKTEKVIMDKVLEAHKKLASLIQQKNDVEKEINDRRKVATELEAEMVKAKLKADANIETLFALR